MCNYTLSRLLYFFFALIVDDFFIISPRDVTFCPFIAAEGKEGDYELVHTLS